MALKSIITIDVDDTRFKEFLKTFDKFQEATKNKDSAPEEQKKQNDALVKSFASVNKMLEQQKKLQEQNNKQWQIATKESEKLYKNTLKTGESIRKTTESLFKWVGLGAGLSTIFGGVGLDKLSATLGGQRTQATRLGVTSGQLLSARYNFGRYGDMDSVLGAIASAQINAGNWAFSSLGINAKGKNAAQILPELLLAAKRKFGPIAGTAMAERSGTAFQLETAGLDIGTMRSVAAASNEELSGQVNRYGGDATRLQLATNQQLGWQDLTSTFEIAMVRIENALSGVLVPFGKSVQEVTNTFVTMFEKFASSGQLTHWVEEISDGVMSMAKTVGSEEFQTKLGKFTGQVEDIVDKLAGILGGLENLHDQVSDDVAMWKGSSVGGVPFLNPIGGINAVNANRAARSFAKMSDDDLTQAYAVKAQFMATGASESDAAAFAANAYSESGTSGDVFASGDYGHAFGRFQLNNSKSVGYFSLPWTGDHGRITVPATYWDLYRKRYGHTMQSLNNGTPAGRKQAESEQDDFVRWYLMTYQPNTWKKLLNTTDPFAKAQIIEGEFEHPKTNDGYTRGALANRLTVHDNTGGSTQITVTSPPGASAPAQVTQGAASNPYYSGFQAGLGTN
jgi:hypothetical protein